MEGRYHHGDLRAALVEVGLRLLAERNVEGVSLREMAREVGVSATSVYRHFPDKTALMSALAREGLDQLGAIQRNASDQEKKGKSSLAATGRAYVRFALANPALFRLIFTSSGKLVAAGEPEAARLLRANVTANLPDDASSDRIKADSLRAWALVHGLAMLMLDGQLPHDAGLIDSLLQ